MNKLGEFIKQSGLKMGAVSQRAEIDYTTLYHACRDNRGTSHKTIRVIVMALRELTGKDLRVEDYLEDDKGESDAAA